MASPYVLDLAALFGPVATQIAAVRASLGLPPLVAPSPPVAGQVGGILFGREQLQRQTSPPRIVIVPTGAHYEAARKSGVQPLTGAVAQSSPKIRTLRWLHLEAHLWGDPDPQYQSALTDFNSAVELERELLTAVYDNCGGTPNVRHEDSRFEQPTDDLRMGRLLILPFSIGTPVVDSPYVVLPYATSTQPGVSVHTTVEATFADGSSSVAGIIVAPPP